MIVNRLQASFLFQLNDVLRVGSNNIRRLPRFCAWAMIDAQTCSEEQLSIKA